VILCDRPKSQQPSTYLPHPIRLILNIVVIVVLLVVLLDDEMLTKLLALNLERAKEHPRQ
jgi:hypothetical protein